MKSACSRWSLVARIVRVGCAAAAVVALAGLVAQVNHPANVKPVVASVVVLADDDSDWAQQQLLQSEQQTEEAEQQAELQNELAEQQAQQDEQQGLLTEQQAQLDVPGS